MMIRHHSNVAAFAGNYVWYWPTQPLTSFRVAVTPAAGGAVGPGMYYQYYQRVVANVI
jgi:hypothetical protein